jgi:GNAT superfamily N-acetyltransferase
MDAGNHAIVRPALIEDLVGLLRVYDESRHAEPTVREYETWEAMLATENLSVYCAEIDGELVGTATLLVMPNLTYGCEPTAFIEAVVVRESWRRKGIATLVLERVIADARATGCNKVQLLSHKRHAEDGAHALYENLGFSAEAEGFRLYLTTVPAKVMAARTRDSRRSRGVFRSLVQSPDEESRD